MKNSIQTSGAGRIPYTILLLMLIASMMLCSATSALAVMPYFDGEAYEFDFENYDYDVEIILDDPIYFMYDDEDLYDPYYEEFIEPDMDEGEGGALNDTNPVTTEPSQKPVSTEEPAATDVLIPPKPDAPISATPRPSKKEPMLYDIPEEVLAADEQFAILMEEATKYIGYPYVWGGHRPETSFDCSGFVSYVFTFSGVYKTGGRGATGLYSLCQPVELEDARPGDLIFFQGTMGKDVKGITHVGIYVGNQMMLHCGNPIGYADLTEDFWQTHFFGYGRLPYEVQ